MTRNTVKLILNLGLYGTFLGAIMYYAQSDRSLPTDPSSVIIAEEDPFKTVRAESQLIRNDSYKTGEPLPQPSFSLKEEILPLTDSPPHPASPSNQLVPMLRPVTLSPDEALRKMEADLEADLSRQRNRKAENKTQPSQNPPPSSESPKRDFFSCDPSPDDGYVKETDVHAALAASKKKSPTLYADAIRVWKNFKTGKSAPHYSYRYWARDLITWLRTEKGYTFNKKDEVATVFRFLQKIGLISVDAALLLTNDVWVQFLYDEVLPDAQENLPSQQEPALRREREIAT